MRRLKSLCMFLSLAASVAGLVVVTSLLSSGGAPGTALAAAAKAPVKQRAVLEKAVLNVTALQPGKEAMAAVVVDLKEGFHAQSNTPTEETYIPFTVTMDENPAVTFGAPRYPPGHIEEYPALGKLNVYTGKVVVRVPVTVK